MFKLYTHKKPVHASSAQVTHIGNLFKQHPKLLPQETCVSSVQVTQPVQAVSTRNLSKQCPSYSHKKPAASKLLAQETCSVQVTPTRNQCEQCQLPKQYVSTRNLSKQCPSYPHKKPVQVTHTRSLSKLVSSLVSMHCVVCVWV